MAYRHRVERLHQRLDEQGYHNVRPALDYVLLAGRKAPVPAKDLSELLGITKQAAFQLVQGIGAA